MQIIDRNAPANRIQKIEQDIYAGRIKPIDLLNDDWDFATEYWAEKSGKFKELMNYLKEKRISTVSGCSAIKGLPQHNIHKSCGISATVGIAIDKENKANLSRLFDGLKKSDFNKINNIELRNFNGAEPSCEGVIFVSGDYNKLMTTEESNGFFENIAEIISREPSAGSMSNQSERIKLAIQQIADRKFNESSIEFKREL